MIGVFDSGHGGLTVFAALTARFPQHDWMYYGDHANAPYGSRTHDEVLELTREAVAKLFMSGCRLVILGCNTATAVAARSLQQDWLPTVNIQRPGHRILGIIAPTVEAVTQTPWSIKEPVFPQKYNTDTVALFATEVTVNSGVFGEEIAKRCPHVRLISQACPKLVPLIESGAARDDMRKVVRDYVDTLLGKVDSAPEWAILGCTHYPLIRDLFVEALPPATRVMDQPKVVADALEDYLGRHPELAGSRTGVIQYFTSGEPGEVSRVAELMMGKEIRFARL